ncbi:uncharacterized protein LOC132053740 [Lycium ferocissimum]|uniref:uncharacterized protein LOC132053740 n=1 Tax=Lycium ferocissimum TaxID=112874 RepID=UPI0028157F95|nr:uncharacterized protein LOC132053740 [Lycium ferocissimum]
MTTLVAVRHDTPFHEYMTWYMHITRSLIANPSTPRPDGRGYASLSGAYEALLRMTLMIRHESIPRTESTDPGIAAYAARIVQLTDTGMTRAQEWHRVDEDVPEPAPEPIPEGGRADRGGRADKGGRAGRDLVDEPDDIAHQAPSATDILSTSSFRPSTSQRLGYTPEMFSHYDPWFILPRLWTRLLLFRLTRLYLQLQLQVALRRPLRRERERERERLAKEPSDQPSQEAVDTQVHFSAPVVQSPSIELSPEASTEATQVETAAVSHRKRIFTQGLKKGRKDDHAINHPVIKRGERGSR